MKPLNENLISNSIEIHSTEYTLNYFVNSSTHADKQNSPLGLGELSGALLEIGASGVSTNNFTTPCEGVNLASGCSCLFWNQLSTYNKTRTRNSYNTFKWKEDNRVWMRKEI